LHLKTGEPFPNLPDDAIGKVWPFCFGNVKHVPGLTFQVVPVGQTLTNIVVPDRTLELALAYMGQRFDQIQTNLQLAAYYLALASWNGDYDSEQFYGQQLVDAQLQQANVGKDAQDRLKLLMQYQYNEDGLLSQAVGPVTQGYTYLANFGKYFPFNTPFYAQVGEFLTYGQVTDDGQGHARYDFQLIQPPLPQMQPWVDPPDPQTGQRQSGIGWIVPSWGEGDMYVDFNNQVQPVYQGQPSVGPHNIMIPAGYPFQDSIQPEGFRLIPAGSTVRIVSDVRMDWIVNIAPMGTVERVWAWRL
jgi:hypothetical protein